MNSTTTQATADRLRLVTNLRGERTTERGRRCSMSAYMDGPWRCGSGDCNGQRDDCEAPRRNAREAQWLTGREWENAWLEHYGLPTPTRRDARDAIR